MTDGNQEVDGIHGSAMRVVALSVNLDTHAFKMFKLDSYNNALREQLYDVVSFITHGLSMSCNLYKPWLSVIS